MLITYYFHYSSEMTITVNSLMCNFSSDLSVVASLIIYLKDSMTRCNMVVFK